MEAADSFPRDEPEEQMMGSMDGTDDEFDEIDVTEDEFDQMMASSERVEIEILPRYYAQWLAAEGYYTLTKVNPSSPAVASGVDGPTRPAGMR